MMWAQFPTLPKHPSTKLAPACKQGSRGNEFPILLSQPIKDKSPVVPFHEITSQ